MPVDYFVWNVDAEVVWNTAFTGEVKAFSLVNHFSGIANGVFCEKCFPAAYAGVNEPFGVKTVKDFLKKVEMGTLDALAVVFEPEPS